MCRCARREGSTLRSARRASVAASRKAWAQGFEEILRPVGAETVECSCAADVVREDRSKIGNGKVFPPGYGHPWPAGIAGVRFRREGCTRRSVIGDVGINLAGRVFLAEGGPFDVPSTLR